MAMASEGTDDFDMTPHRQTYDFVVNLFKYGTVACVIVLVLMAIFLV